MNNKDLKRNAFVLSCFFLLIFVCSFPVAGQSLASQPTAFCKQAIAEEVQFFTPDLIFDLEYSGKTSFTSIKETLYRQLPVFMSAYNYSSLECFFDKSVNINAWNIDGVKSLDLQAINTKIKELIKINLRCLDE